MYINEIIQAEFLSSMLNMVKLFGVICYGINDFVSSRNIPSNNVTRNIYIIITTRHMSETYWKMSF